jgi:hypothetical protein
MATKNASTSAISTQQLNRLKPEQPEPSTCTARKVLQYACVTTEKGREWAVPTDLVVDFPGGRRVLMHEVDFYDDMMDPENWILESESSDPDNYPWMVLRRNKSKSPYYRDPGAPRDPVEHKNALKLDNFLRGLGLSDVHIAYILDAVKPFKLVPHFSGPVIKIKGIVSSKGTRRPARKSA